MARAVVAATAIAVALSTSVAPAPVSAEFLDDKCESALPVAGAIAGVVSPQNKRDWWWQLGSPGRYLVTLTSAPGEAALTVTDSACGTLCTGVEVVDGVSECFASTTGLGLRIGVAYASESLPAAYTLAVKPLGPGVTACSDWLDNDGDGFVDGTDGGCLGVLDDSEDDYSACPQYRVGAACLSLTPGAEYKRFSRDVAPHRTQEVAAYLDMYRFDLPLAPAVEVPCVSVLVEPWGTNNTCGFAGGQLPPGVRVERTSRTPLYTTAYAHTPLDDPLTVSVCYAELTTAVGAQTDTRQILSQCTRVPVDD